MVHQGREIKILLTIHVDVNPFQVDFNTDELFNEVVYNSPGMNSECVVPRLLLLYLAQQASTYQLNENSDHHKRSPPCCFSYRAVPEVVVRPIQVYRVDLEAPLLDLLDSVSIKIYAA